MRKVSTIRKSKLMINNEKQDLFQLVSIWFWCSRYFIIPYIFNKHETWSSFILNSVSKFKQWKGRDFNGRSRAALSLAAPLDLIEPTWNESVVHSRRR